MQFRPLSISIFISSIYGFLWKFVVSSSIQQKMLYYVLWQYELWSFQTGGTKLERFLPKNQYTKKEIIEF